jgi:hypothetical protein
VGITITICYLGLSNLYGSMTMEHDCSIPSNKFYKPGTKHTELCMGGLSTGPLSEVENGSRGKQWLVRQFSCLSYNVHKGNGD